MDLDLPGRHGIALTLNPRIKGALNRARRFFGRGRPPAARRFYRDLGLAGPPIGANAGFTDAWDSLRADYEASKASRFRETLTGVAPGGSGADFHYRSDADYLKLMELGRNFDRNDMIVGQGISRLIKNVLQSGIRLNPQTGDKEVDAKLAKRWRRWTEDAEACHNTGELTFHEQAKLVLRAVLVDGDHLVLPLANGTLQLVEGHRLRSPAQGMMNKIVMGVRLSEERRPIEYFLTKDEINPNRPVTLADLRIFPARDPDGNRLVFHILNRKRVSQTRGISVTASIADAVSMLGHVQFAHLVQAQLCAAFVIMHTFEETETRIGKRAPKGAQTKEAQADGSTRILEKVSPGMEIFGRPGETITGFSPNVPNPEFFPHAMMIMTFIAINLDLPIHALLLDAKHTNFSGQRAAMDQAKYGFREIQDWMIKRLYDPVYKFKINQWVDEDDELSRIATNLDGRGDSIYAHDWQKPSWPYIEPAKDVEADRKRLDHGLTSPRRLYAERSLDWDDVLVEIVEDRGALVRRAIQESEAINSEFPEADVNWRDLAPGIGNPQRRLPSPSQSPGTGREGRPPPRNGRAMAQPTNGRGVVDHVA